MSGRFDRTVVAVTGASSGVGRAIVRAFANEGARLALMARNREALDNAATEVRDAGAQVLVLPVDVSDSGAVHQAADTIAETFGSIDIWVNCAMATVFGRVEHVSPEEFARVSAVSYHGYVYGTMAALRHMRERDAGRIIQIGSAMAYRSIPLQSAYCGARAAVRGFTDSLRTELLHDGSSIQVSQLQLPAVNTPQPLRQRNKTGWLSQPVPPMFSPESMAETVLWAAERMPREMLVGWPSVRAVWAEKLFAGSADWFLSRNGIEGQLTETPLDPDRKDILFETLPGDPGASGPYEDRQRGDDWQMMVRRNLGPIGLVLGVVIAGTISLMGRRR